MSILHKNTEYVERLFDKLKAFYGVEQNLELAEILQVSSSRLSNWKRRGSVDYEVIISHCVANNIDLNSLFCDDNIKVITKTQDPVLLSSISSELRKLQENQTKIILEKIGDN